MYNDVCWIEDDLIPLIAILSECAAEDLSIGGVALSLMVCWHSGPLTTWGLWSTNKKCHSIFYLQLDRYHHHICTKQITSYRVLPSLYLGLFVSQHGSVSRTTLQFRNYLNERPCCISSSVSRGNMNSALIRTAAIAFIQRNTLGKALMSLQWEKAPKE